MEYLLDTNICTYIIKKRPEEIFNKFLTLSLGSVAISSITLAELEYGISKSSFPEKNRVALKKFLTPIEISEFGIEAAEQYGEIRSNLEKKGMTIGPLDLLIGSHAKSLNITLVTNNEKEFNRIPDLKIENWIR